MIEITIDDTALRSTRQQVAMLDSAVKKARRRALRDTLRRSSAIIKTYVDKEYKAPAKYFRRLVKTRVGRDGSGTIWMSGRELNYAIFLPKFNMGRWKSRNARRLKPGYRGQHGLKVKLRPGYTERMESAYEIPVGPGKSVVLVDGVASNTIGIASIVEDNRREIHAALLAYMNARYEYWINRYLENILVGV
jgi:hypothetical protein